VVWLDTDEAVEITQGKILGGVYSRFPVAQGSLDRVIGIVQSKDLLDNMLAGKPLTFGDLLCSRILYRRVHCVEGVGTPAPLNVHIALVIDEFGGFQGW
jgi:putative hemolysin